MVADVFWKLKSTEMQNNDTSKYLIIIFWSGRLSYVTILLLVNLSDSFSQKYHFTHTIYCSVSVQI